MEMAVRFSIDAVQHMTSKATHVSQRPSPSCHTPFLTCWGSTHNHSQWLWTTKPKRDLSSFENTVGRSFIHYTGIYIAPLQGGYSEALPTPAQPNKNHIKLRKECLRKGSREW